MNRRKGLICLLIPGTFKKGDMPPSGYVDWHEWARTQHRGGLRQSWCRFNERYEFPQEHRAHGLQKRMVV